jgi:hypothetical protein
MPSILAVLEILRLLRTRVVASHTLIQFHRDKMQVAPMEVIMPLQPLSKDTLEASGGRLSIPLGINKVDEDVLPFSDY